MFISILLLAAAQVAPPSPAPEATTSEASSRLRQAVGAILRADGEETARILAEVPEAELDADDRRFRACVASRLVTPAPSETVPGTMTRDLLSRYRSYWTAAMTGGQDRDRLEESLRRDLVQMLELRPDATWEAVETSIGERLGDVGLHSQLGRTGHLRDLMIWGEQTARSEYVELPGASTNTEVTYLDRFASRGWSSYFTCDRTGTGGWTTDQGLFVVVPAYEDLQGEHFRINFLAHESQHFVDKVGLPGLEDWQLEFRAKLVEVALADETLTRVLTSFDANRGSDPSEPHSYANAQVLAVLRGRLRLPDQADLTAVEADAVRIAAREELALDTGRRECRRDARH